MSIKVLILSLWCFYGVSAFDVDRFWEQLDRNSLMLRSFTDTDACYDNLVVADKDEDMRLTRDEYATFTKLTGPEGFLANVDDWEDLPLPFQSTFLALSCLCPDSPKTDCCNDEININGVGGGPTKTEENDLFLICALTRVAVASIVDTVPSAPPTKEPPPVDTVPSAPPTKEPPPVGPTNSVSIEYRVGVTGGVYGEEYNNELIGAMDALVPEVLTETLEGRRRMSSNLRRRLQSVALPTSIDSYLSDECGVYISSSDGCASIKAFMILQFQPEDGVNQDSVAANFKEKLDEAISSGDLQEKLDILYPDTNVYILDSNVPGPKPGSDDEDGAVIEKGGIVGIAIASAAVVALCVCYAVAARNNREDKPAPRALPNAPNPAPLELSYLDDDEADLSAPSPVDGTLGAVRPKYGKKKKKEDPPADHDSDAGDSGWSSSSGVSSLNTGDQTGDLGDLGLDDDAALESAGTISMASVGAQQLQAFRSDEPAVPGTPSSVTRLDLDSAIEAGDWAAVGATAALLAAASDTNSISSRSLTGAGTSTRDGSTVSSYDAARAAELDHLVDAGDWEGVVLAAARYEAASTVASGSEAASLSSSMSRSRKQEDWRSQVEDLVHRVVPEEIENIDEMMLQFRGREEELVETLRTMELRELAKQARSKAKSPKKSLFGFGGTKASSKSLGTGQLTSQAKSARSLGTGTVQSTKPLSGREMKQNTLEEAIEAGDWEAVGEAAAMLNDASSASSADTDEINRLADGLSSQGSNLSGGSAKRTSRAEELDKLIDKGDWMGVVQAAADFETEEVKKDETKMSKTKSWFSRKQKKEEQEARKEKRLKELKDEQQALEQAEIWMAIAEKSRDDGDEDKGASDAADWAIGRSLAALVEAEGSGKTKDSYRSNKAPLEASNSEDEV